MAKSSGHSQITQCSDKSRLISISQVASIMRNRSLFLTNIVRGNIPICLFLRVMLALIISFSSSSPSPARAQNNNVIFMRYLSNELFHFRSIFFPRFPHHVSPEKNDSATVSPEMRRLINFILVFFLSFLDMVRASFPVSKI